MFRKVLGFFSKKRSGDAAKPPATDSDANGSAAAPAMDPVPTAPPTATAEELCGLTDGMTHEELREHLAKLYRRHNRAASSLNPELRSEAERMLDAIVEVRHTYLE